MFKFQGNINGTVLSQPIVLPSTIKNFRLVNISGSSANVTLKVKGSSYEYCVLDSPKVLTSGQMYSEAVDILLYVGEQVSLTTTGSVDYLFNIES